MKNFPHGATICGKRTPGALRHHVELYHIIAKKNNGTFRVKFFGSGDERTVRAKSMKLWRNREQFSPSRKCRELFDAGIQEVEHVEREREQRTSQNETEDFVGVLAPTQSPPEAIASLVPSSSNPVASPSCASPVSQSSAMGLPMTSGSPVMQMVVTVTSPHHEVAVASPNGSSTLQGKARSGPKRGGDGRFKTTGGDGECSSAAHRFLKDVEEKIRPGIKRKRTDDGSFAKETPAERGWRVFIMEQWPDVTVTCCGNDFDNPGTLRHHIQNKHIKYKKYRLG